MDRIITGDETLVYHDKPESKRYKDKEMVGAKVRLGRVRPDGQRPAVELFMHGGGTLLTKHTSPRRGASGYAWTRWASPATENLGEADHQDRGLLAQQVSARV